MEKVKRFAFCLVTLYFFAFLEAKVVYFVPFDGHDPKQLFFEPQVFRDEVAKPFCKLREMFERRGYEVKFTTTGENLGNFDLLISLTDISARLLKNLVKHPRDKCWLLVFEPHVVMPEIYQPHIAKRFGKIFVMFDDMVDNKTYYKLFYPQPRLEQIEGIPNFEDKKLCTLIAGNKNSTHPHSLYNERRKIIAFFEQFARNEFDLYGSGWKGFVCWKGKIEQKWEVIKNYKFSICYENMGKQRGYITEKIFDAMIGGSVPIYLGASNILDYVPQSCFIDRNNFDSEWDLYQHLKNIDKETYMNYMRAIRDYLDSPRAKLYSIENFINSIQEQLPS